MKNYTTISNPPGGTECVALHGFEDLEPVFAFNCGTRNGHGVIIMRNITQERPLQPSDVPGVKGGDGVLGGEGILKLYKKYVKDDPAEFIWIEALKCYRYESLE